MLSKGMVHGIEVIPSSEEVFCDTCVKVKTTCQLFHNESKTWVSKYGEWIHTNVWGPAHVKSLSGKMY